MLSQVGFSFLTFKYKERMSNLSNPYVSVIIPVYNDPERLKICLEALENQTYPKSCYEVIVVDNCSDESIKGIVSQFCQAVATYESRIGSYAARNKGISLAKGDVIAFTDADCIPASNWIEKGVASLVSVPNCGLVAGRIDLFFKNPTQPNVVELYDSYYTTFCSQQTFIQEHFGATANVFTFKSVIDKVGSFNHNLKSCGDQEWGKRIFSSGYQQIYVDDVCVAHPARYQLKQLAKKAVRVTGGLYDLYKKNNQEFFIDLARNLLPPCKIYSIAWSNEKLKGNKQKFEFTFVHLYLKYLTAWEKIRLKLGGESQRG